MNINIKNRLVLIIGPSTTGKTNLSKKIKREANKKSIIISHDDVLKDIDQSLPQEQRDYVFRLEFIRQIAEAIEDKTNELIILDTVNVKSQSLMAVLLIIRMVIGYTGELSLIKMNLSPEQHKRYVLKRSESNSSINISAIFSQMSIYTSIQGSLHRKFDLANEEIIIDNPEDIELNFGTYEGPKKLENKTPRKI